MEVGDEFEPQFYELPEDVRAEVLALSRLLKQFGPLTVKEREAKQLKQKERK